MIDYRIDSRIKQKKLEELIVPPLVVTVNDFTEASATLFRQQFQDAVNTGQNVVPIVIDSYGGECYSVMSMVDTIKSSPVAVATIATGKAMSCGAILFTCGTEGHRYIDRHTTVMIHDVSWCTHGKTEEIKSCAEQIERLNRQGYELMAKNVGKDPNYFIDIVHKRGHADWYLNADECIAHNIANHVRVPRFNIRIVVESTFE